MNMNHLTANPENTPRHPIQVVSRRTGLSPDVIRVWERRYGVVKPQRNELARRYYSDADVKRLLLLRRVTQSGRRIGDVAELDNSALAAMAEEDQAAVAQSGSSGFTSKDKGVNSHCSACLEAVHNMDRITLNAALKHAAVSVSLPVLLDEVIAPLVKEIGLQWSNGELRIYNEHLATSQIIAFLQTLLSTSNINEDGPVLLVTTPLGQSHEIGALLTAVSAGIEGWNVIYLGPNTPAVEISAASLKTRARAIALSITYPADDTRVNDELCTLKEHLSADVAILVGGRSASSYHQVLSQIQAIELTDLNELREQLNQLRLQFKS